METIKIQLTEDDLVVLEKIADLINKRPEKIARDALDDYVAALLADELGCVMQCKWEGGAL